MSVVGNQMKEIGCDIVFKNWSFIYPDERTPQLAPPYDFVATVVYIPNGQLALTLVDTKNMYDINLQHFSKLAHKAGIPEYLIIPIVKETIAKTLIAWDRHKKNYDLPNEMRVRIQKHMDALPLVQAH